MLKVKEIIMVSFLHELQSRIDGPKSNVYRGHDIHVVCQIDRNHLLRYPLIPLGTDIQKLYAYWAVAESSTSPSACSVRTLTTTFSCLQPLRCNLHTSVRICTPPRAHPLAAGRPRFASQSAGSPLAGKSPTAAGEGSIRGWMGRRILPCTNCIGDTNICYDDNFGYRHFVVLL